MLSPTGRIIGHVAVDTDASGIRFRAQRYHVASQKFRIAGDFWFVNDAIDCLRAGVSA